MKQNEQFFSNWGWWVAGTVFTAILPFLIALFKFIDNDYKGYFSDYVGLCDTLAFLFSVSLNCFILAMDRRIKVNISLRRVLIGISLFSTALSLVWYSFAAGKGSNNKNAIFVTIVVLSIINLVLGIIIQSQNEKKHKR